MALFQKSVLKKNLDDLNKEVIALAYTKFRNNFADLAKQSNIKEAKEEQYQEGFLRDLFVDVLGYTLNPNTGFNLTTEYKNEKDSKKADGAVLKEGIALAVIELKGTDTVDLGHVEAQAFGYKNNQKGCRYIITSNFEKLRFYIEDSVEHLEFDLFNLDEDQFKILYLCLQKDNLLNNLPFAIKDASVNQEQDITKKLYNDYSNFKRKLYQNICALNPGFDKLIVYKRTQKLLDRFLFILFAEDKQLLPPNSIREILKQWEQLKELDEHVPLYTRYQKYFGYMNTGHKGKVHDIFAYNGGLFAPDEVLDTIKLDDQLLYDSTFALSQYDFETEVDVNILGHIFEHSLNDVDAVTAESEGKQLEKEKTRRKKDGVFYTPKYITKYIVENTVGKLCAEKKAELEIKDEDYSGGKKKKDKKALNDKLENYRQWLLQLTILDPACGSGAFLNQALEFLIAEHRKVDELRSKLFEDSLVLSDVENHILENNLFGVDLNEESIEIAKLSLWLRTAKKGRKLSSLNSNIKCGNSLIDDKTVAGDKAFVWAVEFKEVFAKGGFDVVVGNPPYVKVQNLSHDEIDWFKNKKEVAYKRIDISIMFFELSKKLLKRGGLLSFITSNQFLVAEYGRKARGFIATKFSIERIIDFGDLPIFEEALTYVSIFTLKNEKPKDFDYRKVVEMYEAIQGNYSGFEKLSLTNIGEEPWLLKDDIQSKLFQKFEGFTSLGEVAKCNYGIVSGNDEIFILDNEKIQANKIEKECLLPLIRASNCYRYNISDYDYHILYPYCLDNGATTLLPLEEIRNRYPNTYNYLKKHEAMLKARKDSRTTFEDAENWYSLTRFGQLEKFNQEEKIIFPGEQKESKFGIDVNRAGYSGARVFSVTTSTKDISIKYLLCILNSNTISFYIKSKFPLKQGGYYSMSSTFVDKIPVKRIDFAEQKTFIGKADKMLSLNKDLHGIQSQFLAVLQSKVALEKPSGKMQNWYELEFKDFVKELEKAKVKLSLAETSEWMPFFTEQKKKAMELKNEIEKTDKEIDKMVYELYNLTPEEIKIVEGV